MEHVQFTWFSVSCPYYHLCFPNFADYLPQCSVCVTAQCDFRSSLTMRTLQVSLFISGTISFLCPSKPWNCDSEPAETKPGPCNLLIYGHLLRTPHVSPTVTMWNACVDFLKANVVFKSSSRSPGRFGRALLPLSTGAGACSLSFMIDARSQMFPAELYLFVSYVPLLRSLATLHFPS